MAEDENTRKDEKNPEPILSYKQATLQGIRLVYPSLLFAILYYVVFEVYMALPKAFWGSDILAFLTSPFNFMENFSNVYSSPLVGLWNNVVSTFVIIFVYLLYYCLLAETRRVSPERVFWGSVIASYVVSIFVWRIEGAPSIGTSIIGFCIIAFLCGSILCDLRVYVYNPKNKPNPLKFGITVFILIVSLYPAITYLLGNSAYVLHLSGLAVCVGLILLRARWDILPEHTKITRGPVEHALTKEIGSR